MAGGRQALQTSSFGEPALWELKADGGQRKVKAIKGLQRLQKLFWLPPHQLGSFERSEGVLGGFLRPQTR